MGSQFPPRPPIQLPPPPLGQVAQAEPPPQELPMSPAAPSIQAGTQLQTGQQPPPPMGLIPPPGVMPRESMLQKLAPFLPTLAGGALGLIGGPNSAVGHFGRGGAEAGSNILQQQALAKRQQEAQKEQNSMKNVGARVEKARRLASTNPAFAEVARAYDTALMDGKFDARESAKIAQMMDGLPDVEGLLAQQESDLAIKQYTAQQQAKSEIDAKLKDRNRQDYMVNGKMLRMDPEDYLKFQLGEMSATNADKRQAASSEASDRRQANTLAAADKRQQAYFADLRERPIQVDKGTQEYLSAATNNFSQLSDISGMLKKNPGALGPISGRLVKDVDAKLLGGMGLDPETVKLVMRMQQAIATKAFENGGKTLTKTELDTYTQFLPAMTDTVQTALTKAQEAIRQLRRSYASRMSVMPKRQGSQLPRTLDDAAGRMAEFGFDEGAENGLAAPPAAGLTPPPGGAAPTERKQINGFWYAKVPGGWKKQAQ